MPSKKKKYNARFPPARIKKIMQTDDDVGKVAAAVPVIISRALELFIESLISRANDITQSKHAKTLSAAHMKQAIESEKKFDFLRDLVASIPDVQSEDVDGEGNVSTANDTDDHATATGAKPWKTGRPRNRRAGDHGGDSSAGRRRTEVTSDDESTEDADTDEGGDETSEETTCSSDNTPNVQPAQLTQATQLPQAAQLMQHAQLPQPAQLMQPAQLPQVAQLMQQPAQLPHPTVPRPAFAVPPGSYNFQPRLGPYLSPFQQQGPPQFLPQDLMPPFPRTMGMLPAERTYTPPVMLSSSNRGNTDDEDYDT